LSAIFKRDGLEVDSGQPQSYENDVGYAKEESDEEESDGMNLSRTARPNSNVTGTISSSKKKNTSGEKTLHNP